MISTARIHISRPERYGKQLASHLGHRSVVTQTDDGWSLVMTGGTSTIRVEPTELTLIVEAETEESLATLRHVLERHLRKFAAKEGELDVSWQNATP